eukprot:3910956-Rhodomonas_salina.1
MSASFGRSSRHDSAVANDLRHGCRCFRKDARDRGAGEGPGPARRGKWGQEAQVGAGATELGLTRFCMMLTLFFFAPPPSPLLNIPPRCHGIASYETEAESTLRVSLDPTGVFFATSSSDRCEIKCQQPSCQYNLQQKRCCLPLILRSCTLGPDAASGRAAGRSGCMICSGEKRCLVRVGTRSRSPGWPLRMTWYSMS